MAFRDVVDQLHDDNRLAHAGATERAHFAALRERADQIDYFNSGLENFNFGVLLDQLGRRTMNRIAFGEFYRASVVHRIPGDVKDATEDALTDRDCDWPAGVVHAHPTLQTFR